MPFDSFYSGKRVLVTGHTGFKGSWLCQWLLSLGAEVHGYALDPQPHEKLFAQLGLSRRLASDTRADLKQSERLAALSREVQPDVVLHLAAQPLVRLSYEIPVETFEVNVLGTIHVLEALRGLERSCAAVMITTDKCYENREWLHGYREEDAMGGYDPYSASKGCAELAISAWRRSFFANHPVRIASARAGNVIGGGDWALDRIVPDCIRSLREGRTIPVRNKTATRPWQHVLEPLSGYLALAAALSAPEIPHTPQKLSLTSGFNFGPNLTSNRTVAQLVEELLKYIPGTWEDCADPNAPHEASKLNLATDKAFHLLGWQPVWNFEQTLEMTAAWYSAEEKSEGVQQLCQRQIETYQTMAQAMGILWANS